jgi:hypothetical protein
MTILAAIWRFLASCASSRSVSGILPVGVEEEIVERPRQVIVMLDVPARAVRDVVFLEMADGVARLAQRLHPWLVLDAAAWVSGEDGFEKVVDVAFEQIQLSLGVAMSEVEFRVIGELPLGLFRIEPDMNRLAGAVAIIASAVIRKSDGEIALADNGMQKSVKNAIHMPAPRVLTYN